MLSNIASGGLLGQSALLEARLCRPLVQLLAYRDLQVGGPGGGPGLLLCMFVTSPAPPPPCYGHVQVLCAVCDAIANLAMRHSRAQSVLAEAGALPALSRMLRSRTPMLMAKACRALGNLGRLHFPLASLPPPKPCLCLRP